jgi:Secretion system C-terminal sorting domain
MKILKIQLLILIVSASFVKGQNFPACDSLIINCCTFNTFGPNTISLTASNNSSVLFDYPGFILFDSNMDTIAVETVNYFGIGGGPQDHILNIVAPLTLPFTGFLNLYILFNDTLACSFPITIPDTTTGIVVAPNIKNSLSIAPNPVYNDSPVTISAGTLQQGNVQIRLFNMQGSLVKNQSLLIKNLNSVDLLVDDILPGIYTIQLQQQDQIFTSRFVKI